MVVVRGLNLYPTMVAAVINGFSELSGDYRIVLDQRPPHDFLPVRVELAKGQRAGAGLGGRIERAIKSKLGAKAVVTVLASGSFPVTEGKTSRVSRPYEGSDHG